MGSKARTWKGVIFSWVSSTIDRRSKEDWLYYCETLSFIQSLISFELVLQGFSLGA